MRPEFDIRMRSSIRQEAGGLKMSDFPLKGQISQLIMIKSRFPLFLDFVFPPASSPFSSFCPLPPAFCLKSTPSKESYVELRFMRRGEGPSLLDRRRLKRPSLRTSIE
jgi:hypothetical protein